MAKASGWLAPALSYIPQWLAFQMRQSEQVGCAVAIAHQGKIVLDTAFGHADLGADEMLTPRHRFRVASHSKSFTAAAIMRLREQGRLKLDDPAGKYVKGLHPDIAAATIAQLLSHTAGIFRDGVDWPYWEGRAPFSDEARIRKDLKLAPAIDANTRLKYSNHGFALAGLVIEAIASEPYAAFVSREILAPIGLSETTPDAALPARAKLARGHSGKVLLGRRVVYPGDQSTHALAAATGFVSTASDLVKFFGQLAPNARKSVLSVASRREMTRPRWRDAFSPIDTGYGLGIMSGSFAGWDWFGHSGGFQGYLTRTAVAPAQGVAISLLTNAADGVPQYGSMACCTSSRAFRPKARHPGRRQTGRDAGGATGVRPTSCRWATRSCSLFPAWRRRFSRSPSSPLRARTRRALRRRAPLEILANQPDASETRTGRSPRFVSRPAEWFRNGHWRKNWRPDTNDGPGALGLRVGIKEHSICLVQLPTGT